MKTNKIFFTAFGFIAGMVCGISMIGILAFKNGQTNSDPTPGVTPIAASDAHNYCKNFQSGAVPLNLVIKGFSIDKSQLDAMNNIIRENPALTGFRIYLGKDNTAKKIGIVVGVDNAGLDAVKNTIYNTDAKNLSPCPPICDNNSPIFLN